MSLNNLPCQHILTENCIIVKMMQKLEKCLRASSYSITHKISKFMNIIKFLSLQNLLKKMIHIRLKGLSIFSLFSCYTFCGKIKELE